MKEEVGTAEADAFNALEAAVVPEAVKGAKEGVDNALLTAQGFRTLTNRHGHAGS